MDKGNNDHDPGWLPEVEELRLRETLAAQMGGEENLARHRAAGRLNVRERIERLLDPGSFHETGAITGVPTFDEDRLVKLFPSNFILGTGRIDRRRVVVGADDFTIRGGAADAAIGQKAAYAERMALELRLPMIRLVDGTGGWGERQISGADGPHLCALQSGHGHHGRDAFHRAGGERRLGIGGRPGRGPGGLFPFLGHAPENGPTLCSRPSGGGTGIGEESRQRRARGNGHIRPPASAP